MRMLYLYIGGGPEMTSVQKKIIAKIDRFNEHGIDTRGLFLSYGVETETALNERIVLRPIRRVENRFFTAIHQRRANGRAASAVIREEVDRYDVIYFRYPGANRHLLQVLEQYGDMILFEHNSKEVEELRLAGESIAFGLRPSTLIPWLQDKVWTIRNEKRVGPKMFQRVRCGLAVTHDMADYEVDRAGGKYTCLGNGNGVDVKSIPLRSAPDYDGTELKMIFMRGASTDAPYHGVDRLLEGLRAYQGDVRLTLFLVGRIFEKEAQWLEKNPVSANVEFTGSLHGEELSRLFDRCHLSFGSLGLHRIRMWEGSVLKVNESLARGIPVVVAYKDMELHYHNEFEPYYYHAPADESPIDLEEVVSLVDRVHADREHPSKMRALAEQFVDYDVKIERASSIIKEIFGR